MNINDLIQLRDEKNLAESDLKIAEAQAAKLKAIADHATSQAEIAQARLQAASERLAALIAIRDQEVSTVQADVDATEQESKFLTAKLSDLLLNAINRCQAIIAEVLGSGIFGPRQELERLNIGLNELRISDMDMQLTALPDVMRQLMDSLNRLIPPIDRARVDEISELAAQIDVLKRERQDVSTSASDARARLAELTARINEIPDAEAVVTTAESGAVAAVQRAVEQQSAFSEASDYAESLRIPLEKYTQALDSLIPGLDLDMPIALLPVRLETRFIASELLIRIYPDEFHQDTHEPELTASEFDWGRHFWEQTWRAGSLKNDESTERRQERRRRELAAWSQLAQRFGPARAAWVARTLQPTNAEDRPQEPVLDDLPPSPLPTIPEPANFRKGVWTRAPYTQVLPDRWVALGYVADKRVFAKWGELIPDPLPTGISPSAETLGPESVDDGTRWMVNFEQAEKKGMGIRILPSDLLTGFDLKTGFDTVVVLGVKATLEPVDSSKRLHGLLEAHHYTWGLDLVPQGTPTNNTPQAKSGYVKRDPGYELSFAAEREGPLNHSSASSDGALAARALGLSQLSPFVFSHVRHADIHDHQDAGHMNTVMWPSTLGYFLTQLMEETFEVGPKDLKSLDWTPYREWRRYFIEQVRACGPLPTLRIANQPYGLLPVSSLTSWSDSNAPWPGTQVGLIDLLRTLRDIWHGALSAVPHITANDSDSDNQLVKLLGMDAASSSFYARRTLGPIYTNNLWFFLLANRLDPNWEIIRDQLGREGLNKMKLGQLVPRLSQASFAAEDFEIAEPLVQEQALSESEPLVDLVNNENYIQWLTNATPKDIHDQTFFQNQPDKPKPMLYRLLRHATLQGYADAAQQKKPLERHLVEPEFVDLTDLTDPDPQSVSLTNTAWRHLLSARTSDFTDWLSGLPQPSAGDRELEEFRRSMIALSQLPSAVLQRLLCESLDLCSYRLDAWITSSVTQRLKAMRVSQPTGIYLGGIGWVENLRPRKNTPQSTGFVHAPSLAHATTAAVLRSGYLSHQGAAEGNLLAIDLSSRRVKLAKWLIEGVRNGQPLGALLGYRFERGLHERYVPSKVELDQYIVHFRNLFPLVAGKLISTKEAVENVAANNVVDGLKLWQRFQLAKESEADPAGWKWSESTIPFGSQGLPAPSHKDFAEVFAELMELADAIDAISDTALAESVYQVVQGNPLRSGGSLDAISRGEAPPQELEVTRTPRTGIGVTHRLLVAFTGTAESPKEWHEHVRAKAEPHLNAWAAKLFGDPTKVLCQVEYEYPDEDLDQPMRVYSRTLSLKDLNLCPLDVLYATPIDEQARRTDLEQRLIYYALKTRNESDGEWESPGDIPATANLRLIFERDPADKISFPELLEIARAARELVSGARAIDDRDVSQPGQSISFGIGLNQMEELKGRADEAVESLTQAYTELHDYFVVSDSGTLALLRNPPYNLPGSLVDNLDNLLDLPSTFDLSAIIDQFDLKKLTELDGLREALLSFAYFGLQRSVPISPAGDTTNERKVLVNQAHSLAQEVGPRVDRLDKMVSVSVVDHLARLHDVFGESFRILPQFTPSVDLNEAIAKVKGAEPEQVNPWFQRIARVWDGAARLDTTLMYAEAISAGDSLNFQIAQLPISADGNDRWVGLPITPMLGGRSSLAIHTPFQFDTTQSLADQSLAGLLIDEWVEVVPNSSETTAVTFHYDAPGACAPQTILLVIPPDLSRAWSLDALEAVILETLELAKLRAVDPDALNANSTLGHYLPALYFAYNQGGDPNGDTISTDFKA